MKLKSSINVSLENLIGWAISKNATPIFVACINKIHKRCVVKEIDASIVLAIAAFDSKFGKFDYMLNESYCNLFLTTTENDGIIHCKRYKQWSDSIDEFISNINDETTLLSLVEIEEYRVTIEQYIHEIRNFRKPTIIPLNNVDTNHEEEIEKLKNYTLDLVNQLNEKDNIISDLQQSRDDMKQELKETNEFKESLKNFLN